MERKYKINCVTAFVSMENYVRDYRDADRFISFCRECKQYGACWACPPFGFSTEEIISKYKDAYLIGIKIIPLKKAENTKETYRKMFERLRKVFDAKLLQLEKNHPGSLAFFAGTCFCCPDGKCARLFGRPCIQPQKMRYSLEAFGFDMEKTSSRLLGMELKWGKNGKQPEYFTLIGGMFTNSPVSSLKSQDNIHIDNCGMETNKKDNIFSGFFI